MDELFEKLHAVTEEYHAAQTAVEKEKASLASLEREIDDVRESQQTLRAEIQKLKGYAL